MAAADPIDSLLDAYFEALSNAGQLRGLAKKPPFEPGSPGVPAAMFEGEPDAQGVVDYKVLPSTVTEAQVRALETRAGGPFPPSFRAYLRHGHFMGVGGKGKRARLPATPSDDPLGEISRYLDGWSGLLPAGYVAFAEDTNDAGALCFDYRNRRQDGDCPVVLFDHDALVPLEEAARGDRAVVEPLAEEFAPSFLDLAREMIGAVLASPPQRRERKAAYDIGVTQLDLEMFFEVLPTAPAAGGEWPHNEFTFLVTRGGSKLRFVIGPAYRRVAIELLRDGEAEYRLDARGVTKVGYANANGGEELTIEVMGHSIVTMRMKPRISIVHKVNNW